MELNDAQRRALTYFMEAGDAGTICNHVKVRTAAALQRRGLIEWAGNKPIKDGGLAMPHYRATEAARATEREKE